MSAELKVNSGKANAAIFKNPLDIAPSETFEFDCGCSVNEWLDESGFRKILYIAPTLVLLNNDALLESQWDTVVEEYDVITLVPQPFVVFLGLTLAAWGWIVTAAVTAYSLYLALTIDTPSASDEAKSSTYNISYRGNHKRPGDPIPVCYGVTRVYPDLAAETWSEYDENMDQVMVQLFSFTQGEADITDMRYEETPLSNYSGLDVEVLQPGDRSTIYS